VDWNSDKYRSNFVLDLLHIGEMDVDVMMDALFNALSENSHQILGGNTRPDKEIEAALNQIIKWFEDNEKYEECYRLKQIKEECLKLK